MGGAAARDARIARGERRRLLVVDDEGSVRRAIERLLRDRYEVLAADSCSAALELLAAEAPSISLVLLDVGFPAGAVQGDEALAEIHARWPWLGVIVLTGRPDVELVLRCTRNGALDYVTKLADLGLVLPDAVERALAIGDLRRRHGELQRELRLVADRERALTDGAFGVGGAPLPAASPDEIRPFAEVTRAHFLYALEACGGNMAEAARRLQVPYDSYRDQLIEWGVVQPGRRKG